MQATHNAVTDKDRAYRRRLAAQGQHQLVVALPRETVALIDELKERHGLRNRSQVLMKLIEQGREVTQPPT
jgi:Ribbon-helix-helix protein, copG family